MNQRINRVDRFIGGDAFLDRIIHEFTILPRNHAVEFPLRNKIDSANTKGRRQKTVVIGRRGTALDVANAALYLASDEAAFISGVCIEVDGARCV